MESLPEISISVEAGLAGDYRGRHEKRRVTVLTRAGWEEACDAVGRAVPWIARRANLLLDGLQPLDLVSGRIRIGSVLLEIGGETRPCERMDEACPGLEAALQPRRRAGSYCRVLVGGVVKLGDEVTVEPAG
ncbi:MAG TPA: MOSC domain-containing protein [Candidatus Polarisedimenticolaceae bacterium]|nr:MOSC domain-containing protein [Candidatus Polarisedimenticolaceae bacterium]